MARASENSRQPAPHPQLAQLLDRLLDETFSDADRQCLNETLRASRDARRFYADYLSLHASLSWRGSQKDDEIPLELDGFAPGSRHQRLALQHGDFDASENGRSAKNGPPVKSSSVSRKTAGSPILGFLGGSLTQLSDPAIWPKALAITTSVGLIGYFASLLVLIVLQTGSRTARTTDRDSVAAPAPPSANEITKSGKSSPNRVVATLSGEADCQWEKGGPADAGSAKSSELRAGQCLRLVSGVAEITFRSGTRVTIQGPTRLTLQSVEACDLEAGRIVARVPRAAVGFTVITPDLTVVDLGTEFGVSVGEDHATDVVVLEGNVEVTRQSAEKPEAAQPDAASSGPRAPIQLRAGQSIRIANGVASTPQDVPAHSQSFIRNLPPTAARPTNDALDVVDLMAGGTGTRGKQFVGVDQTNGQFGHLQRFKDRRGDGKYHAMSTHRALDGTFIPNQKMTVDSAGNTFEFPATSGVAWDQVWGTSGISAEENPPFRARLGDVDYSQPGHSSLLIHCNSGLTFDLKAIRRGQRGRDVVGFRAMAGHGNFPNAVHKVDLFVIVDGKSKFERRGFTAKDTPFEVRVALNQDDRFLTLATTDGGDGFAFDQMLFGDPELQLAELGGKAK